MKTFLLVASLLISRNLLARQVHVFIDTDKDDVSHNIYTNHLN